MVGGNYVAKNLRLLRPEGRLVFINAMNGPRAEFDALDIMARRLTITGSTLRSRERAFKSALAAALSATSGHSSSQDGLRLMFTRSFGWTKRPQRID